MITYNLSLLASLYNNFDFFHSRISGPRWGRNENVECATPKICQKNLKKNHKHI